MKNLKTILTLAFVAVAAGLTYYLTGSKTETIPAPVADTNTNTPVTENTPTTPKVVSKYKDGTYTVTTNYFAPPGKEEMDVTVTITNDKITAASIKNLAKDDNSKNYQKNFGEKIGVTLNNQNLDLMKLKVLSGASFTTAAFNEALDQIRAQAKI